MSDYVCLAPPHASDEVAKGFRDGRADVVGVTMATSCVVVIETDRGTGEEPLEWLGLVHPPAEKAEDIGISSGDCCCHRGPGAGVHEASGKGRPKNTGDEHTKRV